MSEEDILTKKIGNKEFKSLSAKPVIVLGETVEIVLGKVGTKNAGKEVGKKLVLICKHEEREEPVKLSSIVSIVGKTVKSSTLWINLDEDKNIQKGSMIDVLLDKYKVETIKDLEGKKLDTELDENKFLVIKAY
ncbi:MAG: hypothetical protein WC711_04000 [Candidatus Staskawiczbacteria bacterium]|jgi:hypothetical protein